MAAPLGPALARVLDDYASEQWSYKVKGSAGAGVRAVAAAAERVVRGAGLVYVFRREARRRLRT